MNIRSDIFRFSLIGALSGILSWLSISPAPWLPLPRYEFIESLLWYLPGIPFGICMVWAINTIGLQFRYSLFVTVILASLLSIVSWYTALMIGADTGFYPGPISSLQKTILSGLIPSLVGVLIVGITLIVILKIPRRVGNWIMGLGLIVTAIGAIVLYSLLRLIISTDNGGVGYFLLFVVWQTTVFVNMAYFLQKFKGV